MTAESLIESVRTWAAPRGDIRGLALVGSHARGEAKPDSDIDLTVVCTDPARYLADTSWPSAFGDVTSLSFEDWGKVQSVRVFYRSGREVEFGIAGLDWMTVPPDAGTAEVLAKGVVILIDRDGVLTQMVQVVHGSS